MIKQLIKADRSLDTKKVRVKASDAPISIDELDGNPKKGTLIEGYIWTGSGYNKAPIIFEVGSGDTVAPATKADWKLLEKSWFVDTKAAEALVDYANEATSDIATIIAIITDTENMTIVSESEVDDPEDGIQLGENKSGEAIYLVQR